jgi:hypothetical protein
MSHPDWPKEELLQYLLYAAMAFRIRLINSFLANGSNINCNSEAWGFVYFEFEDYVVIRHWWLSPKEVITFTISVEPDANIEPEILPLQHGLEDNDWPTLDVSLLLLAIQNGQADSQDVIRPRTKPF